MVITHSGKDSSYATKIHKDHPHSHFSVNPRVRKAVEKKIRQCTEDEMNHLFSVCIRRHRVLRESEIKA